MQKHKILNCMTKGITIVDGKFYQKHVVVMLPTEKATKGCILKDMVMGGFRVNNDKDGYQYNPKNFIAQHLYILSDEEIKEFDWVIPNNPEFAFRPWEFKKEPCPLPYWGWKESCKKIIATTDPELTFAALEHTRDLMKGCKYNLPRPSNAFLKAYCEKGGISEILVEYVDYCDYEGEELWEIQQDLRLKIAPDNTIAIKEVQEKESWNREEVIRLCESAWFDGMNKTHDNLIEESGKTVGELFEEWKSKNL